MSREIHFVDTLQPFLQALSDVYLEQQDFQNALIAYWPFVAVEDSQFNIAHSEKIAKLETARAIRLKQKDLEIAKLSIAKKRNERIYYISGIGRKKAAELKSKESSLSHKSYGMKVTGDRLRILAEMNEVQTSAVIEDLKDEQAIHQAQG